MTITPPQRAALIGLVLLAALCAGIALARSQAARARAEQTIHTADSTAAAEMAKGMAANTRANAEHSRADREKARADSLSALASSAGRVVRAQVTRAETARAAVDAPTFAGLPSQVQRALEEGDSLRLAVPPMIARYESAIVAHVATEARLELTIAKKDSTIAFQASALAQKDTVIHALEQLRGPRCGWKCGAVIGAVGTLVVSRGGDLLSLFTRSR